MPYRLRVDRRAPILLENPDSATYPVGFTPWASSPDFELFRELDGGGALRSALDRYARIAPLAGFVAADGGDRLPQLRVVGGKE